MSKIGEPEVIRAAPQGYNAPLIVSRPPSTSPDLLITDYEILVIYDRPHAEIALPGMRVTSYYILRIHR